MPQVCFLPFLRFGWSISRAKRWCRLVGQSSGKYCFYARALWRFAYRMGLAWIFLRNLWRVSLAFHDANGHLVWALVSLLWKPRVGAFGLTIFSPRCAGNAFPRSEATHFCSGKNGVRCKDLYPCGRLLAALCFGGMRFPNYLIINRFAMRAFLRCKRGYIVRPYGLSWRAKWAFSAH